MRETTPPGFDLNPNPQGGGPQEGGSEDVEFPAEEKDAQSGEGRRRKREAAATGDAKFKPFEVNFAVTLDFWQGGFVSKQLDDPRIATSRITADQAVALKLLACSLNRQSVRTANHRFVQSNPDALRFLLDQVVRQIPSKLMAELKKEAC